MAEEEPERRPRLLDDPEDPFGRICDVELDHLDGCRFDVAFRTREGELLMEEPTPMGPGHGPEAVSLFLASTTYCMASSLNYYLAKARVVPQELSAKGHVDMRLTEDMFRRIEKLDIDIHIVVADKEMKRLMRALERFTQLCIITESIKGSFPINVRVHHPWGLHLAVSD
ncbi:MAG: OsmC family protein [Thermoplasmata archaeon]|nr:MAG: OsmC family protein [Thermoplasmata archaeon]